MNVRIGALVGTALLAALGCGDGAAKPDSTSHKPDAGASMDASALRDAAMAGEEPEDAAQQPADAAQQLADSAQGPADSGPMTNDAQSAQDSCMPSTCQNGGTCSQDDAGVHCACAPGFEGTHCEVELTGCAANPCVHASQCTDDASDFTCTCESGWFGKKCNVSCDDHDAATTDSLHPIYGCAHRKGDFTKFDSGLYADYTTKLGWWVLSGYLTYDVAKTSCTDLVAAGHDDFRLPTIDNVRSLAGDCPATAPGGTCPISDPSCLNEACGYGTKNECASCIGGPSATHENPFGYCRVDVPLCENWWTSSSCTDCAPGELWFYGIINGNFYHTQAQYGQPSVCVTPLTDL